MSDSSTAAAPSAKQAVRVGVLVRASCRDRRAAASASGRPASRARMAHTAASVPPALSPPTAMRRAVECQASSQLRPATTAKRIPGIVRRPSGTCAPAPAGSRATARRSRSLAQHAAQRVVGRDAADREAAAVEVQQHRQALVRRRIEPRRQRMAVARGDSAKSSTRASCGLGHFEHAGALLVGRLGLLGRQGVQRRMAGAGHAVDHAGHLGRQRGARVWFMGKGRCTC